MSTATTKSFDNIVLRLRGRSCVVATVAPPFVMGYWPDIEELLPSIGLAEVSATSLTLPDIEERFLASLAKWSPETKPFAPGRCGFTERSENIHAARLSRGSAFSVNLAGDFSRRTILGIISVFAQRVRSGGRMDVSLRNWDWTTDWLESREKLGDILTYLFFDRGVECKITFNTNLRSVPEELWEFIYERPALRLSWTAAEFAGCASIEELGSIRERSVGLTNLEKLANTGALPYIILPATQANASVLHEIVLVLAEITRGGEIDIIPSPLLAGCTDHPAPPVSEYVTALLSIYKERRVSLRAIGLQSWVAARIDRATPMPSSPEASGTAVTVLANGDAYPAEAAVGLEDWCLGNVVADGGGVRWERLDAMPEVFCLANAPEPCHSCDWRYRCGGVDCSVLLDKERLGRSSLAHESVFGLYCAPRKALFEEEIWDLAMNQASAKIARPRELIELAKDGIKFVPASSSARPGR